MALPLALPGSITVTNDVITVPFNANDDQSASPEEQHLHWPSMADQSWANEIHEFYGSSPYWE